MPVMQRLGWLQLRHTSHLHSYVLRLPASRNTTAVFVLPDPGPAGEAEEALVEETFDTWTQPLPLR